MSKLFNDTQKASQSLVRRPRNQELDIDNLLDGLKQGSRNTAEVARARLQDCPRIAAGNGSATLLKLQRGESAQTVFEAYRGLRTKLIRHQTEQGFKSIVVSSAMVNEGKTLSVINLGMCYSQLRDQRVLVIDADLRKRGLTKLLGNSGSIGLAQVLEDDVNPKDAILATELSNFFALPAGPISMLPAELFAGRRWSELLGWCAETFTVVLVDTPPILPLADFELISAACDRILMVVRARHSQPALIQKTAATLDPKKLLGVVFNGTDENAREYYGYGQGGQ